MERLGRMICAEPALDMSAGGFVIDKEQILLVSRVDAGNLGNFQKFPAITKSKCRYHSRGKKPDLFKSRLRKTIDKCWYRWEWNEGVLLCNNSHLSINPSSDPFKFQN